MFLFVKTIIQGWNYMQAMDMMGGLVLCCPCSWPLGVVPFNVFHLTWGLGFTLYTCRCALQSTKHAKQSAYTKQIFIGTSNYYKVYKSWSPSSCFLVSVGMFAMDKTGCRTKCLLDFSTNWNLYFKNLLDNKGMFLLIRHCFHLHLEMGHGGDHYFSTGIHLNILWKIVQWKSNLNKVIRFQAWYVKRQQRRLPPYRCPLVIALVPLHCPSKNLLFPHRVPFTKEIMPWCPCPFQAYRPEAI